MDESSRKEQEDESGDADAPLVPARRGALVPPNKNTSSSSGVVEKLMSLFNQAISEVDVVAATNRVEALRAAHPDATTDALVEMLVRQKCQETGLVGAATSSAALLPGLGTLTSMTLGVAADMGATFKLQAELVLEIATAHDRVLSESERRQVVMLITGMSTGGNQLLTRTGRELSVKVTQKYAQKWVEHALPVLGVVASAGTNVLSTYLIGQRAHAYFGLGPDALGDWREGLRALIGADKRSLDAMRGGAQAAAGTVGRLGKSSGEAVALGAGRAAESATDLGRGVAHGVGEVAQGVADGALTVGKTVTSKVATAGSAAAAAGRAAGSALTGAGQAAGSALTGVGQAATERLGEAVGDAKARAGGTVRRVRGLMRRGKSKQQPQELLSHDEDVYEAEYVMLDDSVEPDEQGLVVEIDAADHKERDE